MCSKGSDRNVHRVQCVLYKISCPHTLCMCIICWGWIYYITRPVLKSSDGFKAGPTASNPAGPLDIRPDAGPMAC